MTKYIFKLLFICLQVWVEALYNISKTCFFLMQQMYPWTDSKTYQRGWKKN